ncbi:MAG: HlyD family efflux transporter periplasmic adaptor subunit [Alphaproteobacteria bacterium]|nr:HlyD family efflux transporter periplasmic adaptor subunit [Alphaproteobacteria bacterium]
MKPLFAPLRSHWRAVAAAIALIAVASFLFAPKALPVDVAPVVRGAIADTVADQGVMRIREAYIVSAPVAGRLERLRLKVGDRVEPEQVLARIRPMSSDFLDPRSQAQARAAVASAEAAYAASLAQTRSAAAARELAERQLTRTTQLAASGIASRQALETAQIEARTARSAEQAARAQARAREADLQVARATLLGPSASGSGATLDLTSPARGLVTRVFQESERPLSAGAPILEIGDRGGLEAAIEFLSEDAVRIREGLPAIIYDWGGPPLRAQVRRVEPQAFTKVSALGVEEQRVLVLLQISEPPERWSGLGAGYRVWGRVTLRQTQAATLAPFGALVRSGPDWAVFVLDRGRARLTPVHVGAMNDTAVEILDGVAAGTDVIVFPSDKVRDGALVRARRNTNG